MRTETVLSLFAEQANVQMSDTNICSDISVATDFIERKSFLISTMLGRADLVLYL